MAKFSIDSREKDELKEENFENLDVTEVTWAKKNGIDFDVDILDGWDQFVFLKRTSKTLNNWKYLEV